MFVSLRILFFFFSLRVVSSNGNPRVVLKDVPIRRYDLPGNNSRIELLDSRNNSLFVGGRGGVWYIDLNKNNPKLSKMVNFPLLEGKAIKSNPAAPLNYDITTLHRAYADSLLVCGSNGKVRKCCNMSEKTLEMNCNDDIKAEGITPLNVTERAPSLYLDGDVYAAVNTDVKDNSLALRRIGPKANIVPEMDKKEQGYVGLAFSGPREDPLQDRVYAFLLRSSEKSEESSSTSWVAQVCKVDMGGSKTLLQKAWTSRLNARLMCGFHEKKQFFNQLLDVTVLQDAKWRESRVYGLFKNSWDMTAVCVYLIEDIDRVFNSSKQCVKDSRKLEASVLQEIKDKPDVKNWVFPVKRGGPLMVSHNNYRHIRVDRVKGGSQGQRDYNVLFLSLDSGSVHKVLEHDERSFIIAELRPFKNRTNILNMLLQPFTKKLYVSSSSEVVEVDLKDCQSYGKECVDCVQARDPYCSWSGTHCTATGKAREPIQDVEHGNGSVCKDTAASFPVTSMHRSENAEIVPLLSKYFLKCPMFSRHAEYSWCHNGSVVTKCEVAEGSCVMYIDSMTPNQVGNYECVSEEGGYVRTLAIHELSTESKAAGLTPSLWALTRFLLLLVLIR